MRCRQPSHFARTKPCFRQPQHRYSLNSSMQKRGNGASRSRRCSWSASRFASISGYCDVSSGRCRRKACWLPTPGGCVPAYRFFAMTMDARVARQHRRARPTTAHAGVRRELCRRRQCGPALCPPRNRPAPREHQSASEVLMPIWVPEPKRATRVRSRIEIVLNDARGPSRRAGMGPQTLEFAILTAARSGEVPSARWSRRATPARARYDRTMSRTLEQFRMS